MAITVSSSIFKRKRAEMGLTLRQVEEKTGVNRGTISNLERGKHIPDGENLLALLIFYGISVEEMILAD